MTDLKHSYKGTTGCENVEFRIWGTGRHALEVNYIVLVCPEGCEEFKHLPLLSEADIDIVKEEGDDWKWYPQSSSSDRRVIQDNRILVPTFREGDPKSCRYRRWDTVSFLFYLKPGQFLKLPEGTYPEITDNTGDVYIKGDGFTKNEAQDYLQGSRGGTDSKKKVVEDLVKKKKEYKKVIKECYKELQRQYDKKTYAKLQNYISMYQSVRKLIDYLKKKSLNQ